MCLWSPEPVLAETESGFRIVQASDQDQIHRFGKWNESRFRFAKFVSLQTAEAGAALEFSFEGTAVAVRLGGHNVPRLPVQHHSASVFCE